MSNNNKLPSKSKIPLNWRFTSRLWTLVSILVKRTSTHQCLYFLSIIKNLWTTSSFMLLSKSRNFTRKKIPWLFCKSSFISWNWWTLQNLRMRHQVSQSQWLKSMVSKSHLPRLLTAWTVSIMPSSWKPSWELLTTRRSMEINQETQTASRIPLKQCSMMLILILKRKLRQIQFSKICMN